MSQFGNQGGPNNPYRPNPGQQPSGAPQKPYGAPNQNPYGPPQTQGPGGGGSRTVYVKKKQKKPISKGLIIGLVVGVIVVPLVCCCGGGYAFWFWDVNNTEKEIADLIRNNKELNSEIGDLVSLKTMIKETGDHPNPNTCVYRAKGSERTAVLEINWTVDDDFNIVVHTIKIRNKGSSRSLQMQ